MKYLNLRSKQTIFWVVLLAGSILFYLLDARSIIPDQTENDIIDGFEPSIGSETHNFFDLIINLLNLLITGALAIAAIKKR